MFSIGTDDKKGGVDRSTTVIAKEPEGNFDFHSAFIHKDTHYHIIVFSWRLYKMKFKFIITDIWIALPANKPNHQLSTNSQSSGNKHTTFIFRTNYYLYFFENVSQHQFNISQYYIIFSLLFLNFFFSSFSDINFCCIMAYIISSSSGNH